MKSKQKKLTLMLLACALSVALFGLAVGCTEEETPPDADPVTVTLSESEIGIEKYETYQLEAEVTGGGTVTWASSDTGVVTVDASGLLTAVGEGTATVTASAGEASDTCAVTVTLSDVAPVLIVDETEISIEKEGQYPLSASVYWKGEPLTGASYTWTASSGSDVASVAEAEEGGFTVSGLKVGTAVYTVSATVHDLVLTETVTITVVNSDIRFEFGDAYTFDEDARAYRTEMNLSLTDTPSAQPIDVAVYDDDDLVGSPALEWTVEDGSVVSAEGGVLTALAAGETALSASYDGVQVSILVTVSLQAVTLSDHLGQIERLDGTGTVQVTLESDLAGTIQKAYFADGTDVLASGGVSGKTLTLEKAKLPKYDEDMGDDVLFTVETDKAIYLCTVDLYTQIIDDAAEFNGFVNLGESVYAEENAANNTRHYGGYFILGNDFDYNHGLYALSDADNATRIFYGTFDGKGHVISNMGTDTTGAIGYTGIFHRLGDGAVVRNIVFENLARTTGVQYGAIIAQYTEARDTHATIENIYIHVNKVYNANTVGQWNSIILNGGGWNWTSIAPLSNLTVRNVIICADEFAEGPGETSVLGHVEVNGGGIQNVYTYGIGSVRINYNDSELVRNAGDVFGAYASRADMVAAENDYSDFYAAENDSFWTEFNGLPYPARLAGEQAMVTFTVDGDVYSEQIVNKGTDMTLPASPVKDGYAFVGWALGDSETAYDFAVNGYEVNADMSFTALWMQAVESVNVSEAEVVTSVLTPGFDTATVGGYTQNYTIDISDVKDSVSGDLTQLIVGTHTYTNNFSYADGIITVSHAPEIGDYGYTNFTAVFAGDSDPVSVTGQILFITLKISDPDEFRSFLRIGENIYAQENTANGTRHTGGYFVLDQDIDFAHGQYTMYEASGRTFYGTLDGRGHVIKDLGPTDTTQGAVAYVGLFERFGDGAVVRNIAFENFSRNSGMNFSSVFASSLEHSDDHVALENIYIHFTKLFYANNAGDWSSILLNGHWNWANIEPFSNVKVNNIIICADEIGGGSGTTDIFGHFEKNSSNIQNVYAYGLGNTMISKNDDRTDRNAKKDIFALYATRDDMIAAAPERDFSDFYAADADGFWVEDADGLPYPARLAELLATVEFVVDGETYDSQTIEKGTAFTLPQEPTKEGYAFIGWALGDGDTAYDFDGNGYTANDDMTFTALWEAAVESSIVSEAEVVTSVLTPGFDTATAGGYAQSYTIDVSDIAESISGTLTALTVGEKEYSTGIGYADGTITVSHALAIGDYGYQNYTAVFENEGETLYVTGQILFITLKISDFNEFTSFLRIGENVYADENASEGTRHTGGYFVLDRDIDFAHQQYMMWEATGRIFYGTLDGRGHVVKDLGPTDVDTTGALSYVGLFQCFGDGAVVRNIAFENFSRTSGMNYASVFASSLESSGVHVTLENIYIHFTKLFYATNEGEQSSILLNGGWNWANIAPFSNVKVNNIIICADEIGSGSGTTDIFGQFAQDSANIQNVYTYGLGKVTLSKNEVGLSGSEKDVFALYATKQDMIADAANRDFSDFYAPEAGGFWTEVDGIPYPTSLCENGAE